MPPPCTDHTDLYDHLIDRERTALPAVAAAARKVCAGCPLKPTCWAENADEPWVQMLRRGKVRLVRRPLTVERRNDILADAFAAHAG